ncbi:condensin complex subunit 2 [Aplysia californica]|uniref:Condensin complex subunit 2 n=1 Tax=Aplysia californica TaxID=6500 RepID=A0ABM0JDB9_APLCA|nr:condensin complex subunit 2 [Aplysia californica]
MSHRDPLSTLTNSPLTPKRPPPSKYGSPSTSRAVGLSSPTPNLANFADLDEGKQRKELRRRSHGHELHRKNLGSPSCSPSTRPSEALNGLTSTQLANHYADCIKLSTENKINAKNAFGLHLIDYMTELVKKKELENFQVASSTLDASVKIYAGRVDFIHTHAYKVLSGLGGNQSKANGNDENEDPDNPNEMDDAASKAKKKKKAGRAQTVETNLKNINADKFDLEFEVDPMFQIMSAAFDEGGASGLLLNRLRCYDDSQSLILDSSTNVNVVEDVEPDNSQESRKSLDISALKELLGNVKLEDRKICPSLCDFKFMEWNKDMSIMHRKFSDFAFDPTAEPQHLPSVEEEVEAIAHEEIDEMDNVEDEPDAGSISNDSGSVTAGDTRTAEFVESAFSDLTQGSVGKLRQILAMQPSDYSYFNKVLMQTWAGPAHWRIAAAAKTSAGKGSDGKSRKKRQKKPPLRLTYSTKETDLDKLFKVSKATTVTQATWSKYTKKRTTLPEDQQLDSQDMLFRLFHKPHIMIKWQSGDSIGVDEGIDNYDYNNKNDVENFCPLVRGDSDDECSGGFDLSNEVNFAQASQDNMSQQSEFSDCDFNGTVLTQDKLVAAPHKVQKIDIKYAKSAKRVDVRKLKSTMWHILTRKEKLQADVPLPVPIAQDDTLSDNGDMSGQQSFRVLKDVLPSNISSGMAKNLTVQTVFACLLYLTNEKTLKLSSSSNMDDISIEQDSRSS